MIPDSIVLNTGMNALVDKLGLVDAERFVALMNRNRFDYTEWRQGLPEDMTVEELSRAAMEYQKELDKLHPIE